MTLSFDYLSEETYWETENFDCGEETVNEFLKDRDEALEYQKHNSAITRLYYDSENNMIGFYTVQVSLLDIDRQSIKNLDWNKKLPRLKSSFPVIHVLYFGVDSRHARKGYGRQMMRDIFDMAFELVRNMGCNFIFAEAIKSENTLKFYTELDFREIDEDDSTLSTTRMVFKIDMPAKE
ncbi:GNAT family N-acetyltransferase [Saccharibacillus sp. CPCC 101409]|uniref:GNAT family N-acetyltransferase n=1 Tax=Saccharibacillus sp. CPCC 101409 TaxID=3058041 RepID=UPI00267314D5|nr:GNAT family N-acetyltransferase [Saccharibacillus sp. CPCC 101409]MDO3408640.1 GNAT family N-acetyltransferase [Saccharibacillus sp. CPCC 101409]